MKSHQQIHRVPCTVSETKLGGQEIALTERGQETARRKRNRKQCRWSKSGSHHPHPTTTRWLPTKRRVPTTWSSTPTGLSHAFFPFGLAPTFWLQKQSWHQILSWKFSTCLYTELPESFIDTYLTISAFASVVNEINRAWKSVSTEKEPLLWRNGSLGLPETNKCSASETG